jgi:hypothetical protein
MPCVTDLCRRRTCLLVSPLICSANVTWAHPARAGPCSTRPESTSLTSGPRAVARRASGAGHGMDKDPFELEADIEATRELVKIVGLELAELFVYSGDRHLFRRQLATVVRRRRGDAGVPRSRVPQPGGLLRTTTRWLFPWSQHSPYPVDHTRLTSRSSHTLQRNVRTSCMTRSTTVLEAVRRFARSVRLNRQAPSVSKPRRSAGRRASCYCECRPRLVIGVGAETSD